MLVQLYQFKARLKPNRQYSVAPNIIWQIQSRPVYSNHFFAAKNGKKEPMTINTKCELFTHQEKIISKKKPIS